MAQIKFKDLKKMTVEERRTKMEELKLELIKSRVGNTKGTSSRPKEIKKIIAKILSIDKRQKQEKK